MNQRSLILNAIREYLQEHGHRSRTYFSASVGEPPLICAAPCISVEVPNYPTLTIGMQLDKQDRIHVYCNNVNPYEALVIVEVSDPNLFDILEAYIINPARKGSDAI